MAVSNPSPPVKAGSSYINAAYVMPSELTPMTV